MRILILFSLLICNGAILFSQELMTLERAISIGLENHYGLKIAENNIKIADNNNSWASVGGGPTLDLNGSFTHNLVKDANPASFLNGTFYSGSLGGNLDANWVIYSGGRLGFAKEQLEQLGAQQRVLYSQEVHNMIKAITQQYNTVLFQREQLGLYKEVHELSKERLAFEETKKEFGSSNSYNLIQFETAVTSDSINFLTQYHLINIAIRQLYQTLNIESDADYTFDNTLDWVKEELDIEKLKAQLLEENYTLRTATIIAELDMLNGQLEEVGRKPTVRLNGNVGVSENAFKFFADNPMTGDPFKTQLSNRVNGGVNLFLNWNLIDGGLNKTNRENAKLQNEINQLTILEATALLYSQLDVLMQNYNNQVTLLELSEIQISAIERNLEMSEERYKAGQISSLDYRAIQNQFLQASTNKIRAIYNLIITRSEIDWLVGVFDKSE